MTLSTMLPQADCGEEDAECQAQPQFLPSKMWRCVTPGRTVSCDISVAIASVGQNIGASKQLLNTSCAGLSPMRAAA